MRQDRSTRRHVLQTALAAACTTAFAAPAFAQEANWPTKPIRMIVPFPAGSFTDTTARVLSEQMTKALGQQVLVENKVGANGLLGMGEAARAAPDGYTVVVTNSSSVTINPQIYKQATYKASDFTPITMVIEAGFVMVLNPAFAEKNKLATVKDVVEYAKTHPGKLSYGSPGVGNIGHLGYEMLSNRANVKTTHIPYKGAAPSQLALIGGEIDSLFDNWSSIPHVQSGKLKAIAVTSDKRMAQLPDVPTIAESGYPDVNVTFWLGLLAPAGTPAPIVQKLHQLAQATQNDARAKAVLSAQGDVVMRDAAAFKQRIEREVPQWGAIIKRENITVE